MNTFWTIMYITIIPMFGFGSLYALVKCFIYGEKNRDEKSLF